ncbi:MAG: amino acid ABC transporter substrate-binding protein [Candidatus Methanomethylicia archaeon]
MNKISISSKSAIARVLVIIIIVVIIIAAIAVAAYMLLKPAPERDYFKIGVILELTGELSRGGYVCKRGYDLWVKVVNDKGGITIDGKSYRVELIYYDAKSDPAEGAKAVDKAIADGVDFLFGPYSSAVCLGTIPVIDKYGIPYFCGSPESHLIPEKKSKWTFQFLVTTRETPIPIIEFISKLPLKTVAIIGADDAFSKSLAESFKAECERKRFQVVFYEIYPLGSTDLSPLITKIKPLNPDVLINAGHPSNHVVVVRNAKELDFNPKIMVFHWGIDTADFLGQLGPDANYALGVTMWSPKASWKDPVFNSPSNFLKLFENIHGREPDYSEASCAATGVFVQKLLETKKLTPPFNAEKREALRKAAEEATVETILGPIKFSTEEAHWHVNIELAKYLVVIQVQNGKLIALAPEAIKEGELIFPKPSWK